VRVLRRAARGFLASLRLDQRELSILVVTDAGIRALNRRWRRKDKPTDVLSFPLEEPARGEGQPVRGRGLDERRGPREASALGDIVISLDTALAQARAGGWSLAAELRRLLAHGLLHCLGHDHALPEAALRMARAERRLLGREGLTGASLAAPREHC
jgi:probable rRNA maturation factor